MCLEQILNVSQRWMKSQTNQTSVKDQSHTAWENQTLANICPGQWFQGCSQEQHKKTPDQTGSGRFDWQLRLSHSNLVELDICRNFRF